MQNDIVATDDFTVSLLEGALSVGRITAPNALKGCAWPLLKSMLHLGCDDESNSSSRQRFFSVTQDEEECTLVMDEGCRAAFDEAAAVATVEYSPQQWCAFELHLFGVGSDEVPGLVCFIATLMAEANISILNLSSHDRDFLLVQEGDVLPAKKVIQERLQRDVLGLKEEITEKAIVRRSGTFSSCGGIEALLVSLDDPVA